MVRDSLRAAPWSQVRQSLEDQVTGTWVRPASGLADVPQGALNLVGGRVLLSDDSPTTRGKPRTGSEPSRWNWNSSLPNRDRSPCATRERLPRRMILTLRQGGLLRCYAIIVRHCVLFQRGDVIVDGVFLSLCCCGRGRSSLPPLRRSDEVSQLCGKKGSHPPCFLSVVGDGDLRKECLRRYKQMTS